METEERIAIQEPDYRLEALKAAATLKNVDLAQLLTNADRIERWLNEPMVKADETRRRNWEEQKKILEKYRRVEHGGVTFNLLHYPQFDEVENKTAQ